MNSFNLLHFEFSGFSKKAVLKAGFSVGSSDNQENVKVAKTDMIKNWYLEIPKVNLKADIQEGTTKEIMDKFIGHFEESKKWEGNVCLAAHNRGYKNNYFSEIKQLQEGDKIIYYFQDNRREYLVEKNDIIEASNVTCLENTEKNTLTLITCVENEPNYRRCIKAIENKK